MSKLSASKALRRSQRAPVNPYLKGVVKSIRATIGTVFVFSFFLNLLALTVPIYLLQIYDKVLPNKNADTLTFLTGIVLLAVLTFGVLESVRRTLLRKIGVNFDNQISEHLLSSSIHRSVKKSSASVSVMQDLAGFREFLSGSSMFPLLDAPWTPLFILILYILHPLLGLVGVVGCVLLFSLALINEFATRHGVKENGIQAKEQLEHARSYLQNADVVQAMGMQRSVLGDWTLGNKDNLIDGYKVSRVNTRLQTVSKMLKLTLVIAIIYVAARLILNEELTAGATIASMLLLRRAISPLEQSISSWRSVIKARNSFQNISDYLDHSSSLGEEVSMPEPSGTLVLENVSYRRSGENKAMLSNLNFSLEPGNIKVISGETASGKSTLLRLLTGLVPPTVGKITLGGYELDQWSREQLGPHIGYLPQTTGLFPGTVRFNIGRLSDQPIEDVIAAAKLARAHEMIQRLPNGYDTEINEGASNLSGGQKQKIGLARALFGNPNIVLLDEPDSALDSEGRSELRKTLRELRENNAAVLVISHHSGILRVADSHYELHDRKLVKKIPKSVASLAHVTKQIEHKKDRNILSDIPVVPIVEATKELPVSKPGLKKNHRITARQASVSDQIERQDADRGGQESAVERESAIDEVSTSETHSPNTADVVQQTITHEQAMVEEVERRRKAFAQNTSSIQRATTQEHVKRRQALVEETIKRRDAKSKNTAERQRLLEQAARKHDLPPVDDVVDFTKTQEAPRRTATREAIAERLVPVRELKSRQKTLAEETAERRLALAQEAIRRQRARSQAAKTRRRAPALEAVSSNDKLSGNHLEKDQSIRSQNIQKLAAAFASGDRETD